MRLCVASGGESDTETSEASAQLADDLFGCFGSWSASAVPTVRIVWSPLVGTERGVNALSVDLWTPLTQSRSTG